MIAASDQCYVRGKNCQDDTSFSLLSEEIIDNLPKSSINRQIDYRFEPIDLSVPLETNSRDMNALVYILGAAAHKLQHEKCRKNLVLDKPEHSFDNEASLKDFFQSGRLRYLITLYMPLAFSLLHASN